MTVGWLLGEVGAVQGGGKEMPGTAFNMVTSNKREITPKIK